MPQNPANRLTEISNWTTGSSENSWRSSQYTAPIFNIEVSDFEVGEIDLQIASLEEPRERDDDPANAAPEAPGGQPLSELADVWTLAGHRVLCGNALDAAAFGALVGEERVATVFTDSPDNVPIDGHASGLGAIHHRPFPMAAGEMDTAQFTAFLAAAVGNLASISAEGCLHYLCMDWRHVEELLDCARSSARELS